MRKPCPLLAAFLIAVFLLGGCGGPITDGSHGPQDDTNQPPEDPDPDPDPAVEIPVQIFVTDSGTGAGVTEDANVTKIVVRVYDGSAPAGKTEFTSKTDGVWKGNVAVSTEGTLRFDAQAISAGTPSLRYCGSSSAEINETGPNSVTIEAGNPVPTGLAMSESADTSVTMSWNAVPGATGYRMYHHSAQTGTFVRTGNDIMAGTSFIDSGLSETAVSLYKVTSFCAEGESAAGAYAEGYVTHSLGEIAAGTGSYADGNLISFGKAFSSPPVVIVNASDASGNPLVAGVRNEAGYAVSTTGFTLKLAAPNAGTYAGTATVQWVAVISGSFSTGRQFLAKLEPEAYDGFPLEFGRTFSSTPIVLCCAYDNAVHSPLIAAPCNISASGFTPALKDPYGDPGMGSLFYIAFVQQPNTRLYRETALLGYRQTYNDNMHIGMFFPVNPTVVLTNGWKNNFPYVTTSKNASSTGFDLGIRTYDNAAGSNVWTYWAAFGLTQ